MPQAPLACVTLLPAPSAQLRLLIPLFSPNHFKNTHTGGGGRERGRRREKVDSERRERLKGEKGAVHSRLWSHFFPPTLHLLYLLLFFSHLPLSHYLSVFSCPLTFTLSLFDFPFIYLPLPLSDSFVSRIWLASTCQTAAAVKRARVDLWTEWPSKDRIRKIDKRF